MAITDPERTERLDLRMTAREKETLRRAAKTTRRTITSLLQEWIENLEKQYPEPRK